MDQIGQNSHGTVTYAPLGSTPQITVLSAAYGDEDHDSLVAQTVERGAIAVSRRDAPQMWLDVHAQAQPAPYVVNLEAEKDRLNALIDAEAGERRKKWLPQDPGIEWVYREKAEEATRYMGKLELGARLEELTVQDFPFLAKSVPYDGPTMEAAANTIWTRHQASRAALAEIEDKRRLNKSVVAASQTVSEARAAFDAATW